MDIWVTIAEIMVFVMALMLSFSILFFCLLIFPSIIVVLFLRKSDKFDRISKKFVRIALIFSAFLSPILAYYLIKFDMF